MLHAIHPTSPTVRNSRALGLGVFTPNSTTS